LHISLFVYQFLRKKKKKKKRLLVLFMFAQLRRSNLYFK